MHCQYQLSFSLKNIHNENIYVYFISNGDVQKQLP